MPNRQFDTRTETKPSLSRQPVRRQKQGHVAETSLLPQRDPLARIISGTGNMLSASTHAAILKCATSGRPSRAGQSLLQLQRQYGNRYVQRVLDLARKGAGDAEVAPELEQSIQRERGGGQALDGKVRGQMESAFGTDFSGVRVHTDAEADKLNRALNAHAFTTGQDIFFRQGAYNPGASSSRELIAHELTHVVQQTGGVRCKLTIGQPDDIYEQEADQVAQAVMQREQQVAQRQVEEEKKEEEEEPVRVQRQTEKEEEEEEKPIQTKVDNSWVQRQVEEEEQEEETSVFRQSDVAIEASVVEPEVEHAIQRKRSGGQALDSKVRSQMERAFGADFSGVRVHTDTEADMLNRSLGARAFTVGRDIFFSRGEYNPGSSIGQEVIAHELTHVVQQIGDAMRRRVEVSATYPINPAKSIYREIVQRATNQQVQAQLVARGIPLADAQALVGLHPARSHAYIRRLGRQVVAHHLPVNRLVTIVNTIPRLSASNATTLMRLHATHTNVQILPLAYGVVNRRRSANRLRVLAVAASPNATAHLVELVRLHRRRNPAYIATLATGLQNNAVGGRPASDVVGLVHIAGRAAANDIVTFMGNANRITAAPLAPQDNFGGRSLVNFGVGEIVDLSANINPPALTAANIGSLRWSLEGGHGRLSRVRTRAGTARYTARQRGPVNLRMSVLRGPYAAVVANVNITVVQPANTSYLQPINNWRAPAPNLQVGFEANIFLEPRDVSFQNIRWREGTARGIGTGYFAGQNPRHRRGNWMTVGAGNSATGCQVNATDTVQTATNSPRNFPGDPPGTPPHHIPGTFTWPIPWQYRALGVPTTQYMIANHEEEILVVGVPSIRIRKAHSGWQV